MTNDQFLLILKAKLKLFYIENKSVGMELKELVAEFREDVISDFCRNKKPTRSIKKNKNESNT